nr:protoporphyrinogen oxidase (PPOX) [Polytomella parva]|eukprot:CAMPEP_0175059408 /NCGR_PEP_ID=MMETSP0052_2-20121109/12417_1 /TAXON_ID=51329 ORGANISM="Polytomella parva, Strain SAG 63-3" /NCGR_SAMPLE_ID=MMETSP0052_2 /ASSEMBLY_ACC=CAM_ASM_000194 /LENGTH=474 /DNA_ID=CAMNT_0016324957 /DNA_START=379 /DNA_END=1803 /DNA_ORIENTATION=+
MNDALYRAARDAGVESKILSADPKLPRWILWGRRLRVAPIGSYALKSDLLSTQGLLRAIRGVTGFGVSPAPPKGQEESVEGFVRRTLGDEIFERLVEPFCSGVYAGDPSKLSMRAAFGKLVEFEETGDGSLLRGVFRYVMNKRRERRTGGAKDGDTVPLNETAKAPKSSSGPTVSSFEGGIEILPKAIAQKLGDRVRLGLRLVRIDPTQLADGTTAYRLSYRRMSHQGDDDSSRTAGAVPRTAEGDVAAGDEDAVVEVVAKKVVLTTPAFDAADILSRSGLVAAANPLKEVDYPPVALVVLSYDVDSISAIHRVSHVAHGLSGFGQLHPRPEGLRTLGTIYGSTLFPNRSPVARTTLLNFVGGSTDRAVGSADPMALAMEVDLDLKKSGLIREGAAKPEVLGVKVYPKAIPQFDIGHLDRVEKAKMMLKNERGGADWSGVKLAGNYVCGVAVGRCIEFGFEIAENLAQELARKK